MRLKTVLQLSHFLHKLRLDHSPPSESQRSSRLSKKGGREGGREGGGREGGNEFDQ